MRLGLKGRNKVGSQGKAAGSTAADARRRPQKRLSPHQLDVFSAIVATGSITSAARHLGVSQPGVSRSLADLEREIGFALFVRDKKRLLITPEGLAFSDEVTRSHVGLERLAKSADEIRQLRRGHLRIAAMPALCFGPVPKAIKTFLDQHPSLTVSFEAQPSQRIVESVAGQHIDVGICQVPAGYPGVTVHASFRSDCVCVMPAGHPLGERQVVGPADLKEQALVALPPNSMAGLRLNHVLQDANVHVVARVETLTSFAACAMVAGGLGVAVLDPFTASAFAHGTLQQRPFQPAVNFGFRLIQPAHRVISRAAQALLVHLGEAMRNDPLVGARA
jgi:DNA-binding transcriptional LysR family regulator